MKKFGFTLQRMLGFKRTLYEKERNTLAHMRAERERLKARRDATEVQMHQLEQAFHHRAATSGVGVEEVTRQSFHRGNALRFIEQIDGELAAMDRAIEKQLKVVVELDKEVKTLEKLREHQWEDYQLEALREEQNRILELVSGRFVQELKDRAQRESV